MSEIKKNIETCRGEDVLAEVSAAPQDPHFGSLVNEAFDPMQQQALHQAGYDGYSEVIAQHKPYTFASFIAQMKSNLLLLLRALWQFPFGSGTLRSLSDMWQHYIDRLSGNSEYGIPSRLSSLTDLPSAPLLVSDRKISGVPDAADGITLAHLIGETSTAAEIEELTDNNERWTYNGALSRLVSLFSGLKKLTLNCETVECSQSGWTDNCANLEQLDMPKVKLIYQKTLVGYNQYGFTNLKVEEMTIPELEEFKSDGYGRLYAVDTHLKRLYIPKFQRLNVVYGCAIAYDCSELLEVYAPHYHGATQWGYSTINTCPKIQRVTIGQSSAFVVSGDHHDFLELRLGEEQGISLDCSTWSPTLTNDNLEQFLKNFRTYIALRLATFASNGPTLTLSQAVFSSIWDANGNPQVLQDGLDQLRADIHNIVKTTKHWDVNKAN